jgi:hypothetical protein
MHYRSLKREGLEKRVPPEQSIYERLPKRHGKRTGDENSSVSDEVNTERKRVS